MSKFESRVLAVSMRPMQLDDVLGNKEVLYTLKNKLQSGRLPHFIIISGNVGTGKTTLARIIAGLLLSPRSDGRFPLTVHPEIWSKWDSYDVTEKNAADENGVGDVREFIKTMRYKPLFNSKVKIVIWDEAHQLTQAAQNALLKDTEEPPEHAFFIFCTSQKNKIIPALLRRADEIEMTGLKPKEIAELVNDARSNTLKGKNTVLTEEFIQCLIDNDVTAPGLILKACEEFFSGGSISSAVFQVPETGLNAYELAKAIAVGSWSRASPLLHQMTKQDAVKVRCIVLSLLKNNLLTKKNGDEMLPIMNAIREISRAPYDDLSVLPATLEALVRACFYIKRVPIPPT